MSNLPTSVAFGDQSVTIIDRNGVPYLAAADLARALGYSSERGSQNASPANRIADLYRRHADEFTASMTDVVRLPTAGGMQEMRVFSPRGCHLIAMFARTPRAAAFRRWVLDVLEGIATPRTVAVRPVKRRAVKHDRPYMHYAHQYENVVRTAAIAIPVMRKWINRDCGRYSMDMCIELRRMIRDLERLHDREEDRLLLVYPAAHSRLLN